MSDLVLRIKSIPISEVLGHYIALKSKGQDSIALCPFHSDSNPSLHVSNKKGIFKCFSCGAGGDALTFVIKYRGFTFREGLMEIAEKFNLPLDEPKSPKGNHPKYQVGPRINKVALKIFCQCAQSPKYPEFAKFIKERKLSPEIVTQFALGYAPNNNALSHYLSSLKGEEKKMAIAVAQEIGLIRVSKRKDGQFYDAFRDRIIFPIWDQYDNVVGLGSRAVFDHQKSKYINSQESFLFNKKRILYGLNFAKQSIRKQSQVILVEGYMDCLALVQNGFAQTVAVMGVAMAAEMVKAMAQMAEDIVLGPDSDEAGFNAAKRMNELFLREGLLPRYLDYSPHKDPDEFLLNESRLSLMERIEQAPTFLDLLIKRELAGDVSQNTDHKLRKLHHIFELVAPLKDNLAATERIVESSKGLGLKSGRDQILDSYGQFLSQQNKGANKFPLQPPPPASEGLAQENTALSLGNASSIEAGSTIVCSKTDQVILEAFASYPECFKSKDHEDLLEYVSCHEVKQLIRHLESVYFEVNEGHYPKMVIEALERESAPPSAVEAVTGGLWRYRASHELDEEKRTKVISDLMRKLKRMHLIEQRGELKQKRQKSETDHEAYEYLKKISAIQQELNQLQR